MSLTSFKDFDMAYIEGFIFSDPGLVTIVDPDVLPQRDTSNYVEQAGAPDDHENTIQRQASIGEYYIRLLTRLFRLRTRSPQSDLQRSSSNSSAASYSSQRVHEALRAQKNIAAFPEFRSNPTFFRRKAPLQGQYRSLKGRTLNALRPTTCHAS